MVEQSGMRKKLGGGLILAPAYANPDVTARPLEISGDKLQPLLSGERERKAT